MKLLQRTARYYFVFSLVIFLLGGLVMFWVLRKVLDYETDEGLQHTRLVLQPYLAELDTLPPRLHIMDEVVDLTPITATSELAVFSDTLFFDTKEQEYEPYRTFTYTDAINGKNYRIALHHSRVENEDLITTILLVNLGIFGLLLLALNWVNTSLSQRLWQPFYETIRSIQSFSIQHDQKLQLPDTQTEEFDQLNRSLERMGNKLQRDYRNLRRFTENASHEMQTPLAIMRNQIDLLLRTDERTPEDYEHIRHLSEAISRLSKLNKALLLLTRIENEQYQNTDLISLRTLLEQKMEALQPLLPEKGIQWQSNIQECILSVHPILADVLLNNLLENAIKHNVQRGNIDLLLDTSQLKISNSGLPLRIPPAELLQRFTKGNMDNLSLGLGLAIVKEICNLYNWTLHYHIQEDQHELSVQFKYID